MGFSNAFPRLPTQPHKIPWACSPRAVLFLLPHLSKWARYIEDIMLTCEDTLHTLLEHERERMWWGVAGRGHGPIKNLRPRYYHKVFSSCMVGYDIHHPRDCYWQMQAYLASKNMRGGSFCSDLGWGLFPTSCIASIPYTTL